jgi:PTH1 family peptidyl-tRNA hydrolase
VAAQGNGSAESAPWLIVGLGNPGPEYAQTPHNLGFLVADLLAERSGIRVTRKECMALVGNGWIANRPVVLAKPQTFMNLSGQAVKSLLVKQEAPLDRLLLIYDDLDLPWGAVRLRPGGSAGGHHGVESVIRSVGSQAFPRLRLGIAPDHPVRDGAAYVLAPFRREQREELDELLDYAVRAVESTIGEGVEKSMTKFNRRARSLQTEE